MAIFIPLAFGLAAGSIWGAAVYLAQKAMKTLRGD